MGLDCTVRFPTEATPPWDAIKSRLASAGAPAPLRMIDGLPAFPDETPEAAWRELRIGFPAGMVSLRKGTGTLTCVIWSNADSALLTARDLLAWACADAGAGTVGTPTGERSATEFAQISGISPA